MDVLNNTRAALPAPRVPAALDGGLGYDDIARSPDISLIVQVGPWSDFADGDTLQILWGAAEVVVGTYSANQVDANKVIDVLVPARAIQNLGDGDHAVKAKVTNILGLAVTSLAVSIRVKLAVPGGHDPDAHTPYANENLDAPLVTPDRIEPGTPRAVVEIKAYENRAEGDLITVRWNVEGNDILYGPLTLAEAQGTQSLFITIDRDTIGNGGVGGAVKITYQVYDVVRNWSLWSPYAQVEVVDPDAPQAPWVEGTVDDAGEVLDVDVLGSVDLTVLVEGSGAVKDQQVVAHWAGTTAAGQALTYDTPPQTPTRPGQTLTFSIPNDKVKPLAQGSARAWYTLGAFAGSPARDSARRNLTLIGQVTQFLPPGVAEAKGTTLDPADLNDGPAHASLPPWIGMKAGDEVVLVGEGLTQSGSSLPWKSEPPTGISGGMVDQPVPIEIPGGVVAALIDGSLRLYYAVTPYGSARPDRDGVRAPRATLRSDPLDLLIRSAGAQPLLDAPDIDRLVDGVLDPDSPDSAHLLIPRYLNIAAKDRVDAAVRGGTVNFDDWIPVTNPAAPPSFPLPTAFIQGNRDQSLTATYTVTRFNDGRLAKSKPLPFRIGKAAGGALPAPTVTQASTDGTLDPFAIPLTGAETVVPTGADLTTGDTATVTFGTYTSSPPQPAQPGITFRIPPGEIAKQMGYGLRRVVYTRWRGGVTTDSDALSLLVGSIPDDDSRVVPPVLAEANPHTLVLDLNTFAGDATVKVIAWPLMDIGQRFYLLAKSSTGAESWIIDTHVGQVGDSSFSLKREWLLALPNAATVYLRLGVYYKEGFNAPATFRSPDYTVGTKTSDFYLDPSPMYLSGTTPVQGHVATGGVPPYAYTSSHPNVISVDPNNGVLRAITNGIADITASDSAIPKHSKSYGVNAGGTTPLYIDPTTLTLTNTTPVHGHQASGGTPPYTYASDNPNLVKVTNTANGTVQAVANGGATVTVYDSAAPKDSKSYQVVASVNPWTHEYNFDQDSLRSIGPGPNEVLYFSFPSGGMSVRFKPDANPPHPSNERLGVERYPIPPDPLPPSKNFSGNILYIGASSVPNTTVLFDFGENWDAVRFYVTNFHNPLSGAFKDASLNIVKSFSFEDEEVGPTYEAQITGDDEGRARIRYLEIHAQNVIWLDSFQFRK